MQNFYRDEINDADPNDSVSDGKSFSYRIKIVGKTTERPSKPWNPGDTDQPA